MNMQPKIHGTIPLAELEQQALSCGKRILVGALIYRVPGPSIFVQRRSLNRKLFPGCWDIVGGHVEAGERLMDCLAREIFEETGWTLSHVDALSYSLDWEAEGEPRREFDFLVRVQGNLDAPTLEQEKHDGFAWIQASAVDTLVKGQDTFVRDVVKKGLEQLAGDPPFSRLLESS